MELKALKIVEEEFNNLLECQLPFGVWLDLRDIRDRITKRIEKECVEIPEELVEQMDSE